MKGMLSFHPVDVSFFDDTIQPLAAGSKINPEPFIGAAVKQRSSHSYVHGFRRGLERLIETATAPPAPVGASRWERLRTWMEKADYRADPVAKTAKRVINADLHLYGRPFMISDVSTEKVATSVDHLRRLDPALGDNVQPDLDAGGSADGVYRSELLNALKQIYLLAKAARRGEAWPGPGGSEPACTALADLLPWMALRMHAQVVPYWVAENVDGLPTVCNAAGVAPPDELMPAWRLFGPLCEEFPALKEQLIGRLNGSRSVGAYVAADDVPAVLEFLNTVGSRIIQAASQAGEGKTASSYLRKVRECATYAVSHGLGYVEASGIGIAGVGELSDD